MQEERIEVATPHVSAALALTQHGAGPAVIFLHGWAHSAAVWRDVIRRAESSHLCLAIDLPGFGRSAHLRTENITLPRYAEIIWEVLRSLTHRQPVLGVVADSMSGLLVLDCLSRFERLPIEKFFLSGVPLDGMPKFIREVQADALTGTSLRLLRALPFPLAHLMISQSNHLTVHRRGKFERLISDMVRRSDPATAGRLLRQMYFPYELSDRFDRERYQITLCRGAHDQVFREPALAPWAQALGAQAITVSDSGHTPMLENPDEYARACAFSWQRASEAPVESRQ